MEHTRTIRIGNVRVDLEERRSHDPRDVRSLTPVETKLVAFLAVAGALAQQPVVALLGLRAGRRSLVRAAGVDGLVALSHLDRPGSDELSLAAERGAPPMTAEGSTEGATVVAPPTGL